MSALEPDFLLYPTVGTAVPLVEDAYSKWSGIAQRAFATAQQLATELTEIPIVPVAFDAKFDPQIALEPFPTIAKPKAPDDLRFNAPQLPPAPPVITIPLLPPDAYVSALLDSLKSAITSMLANGALPAAVGDALRDRAYAEAYAEEQRAVSQAYDEFAARGFFEPDGVLNARITEARSDARQKRQQASRDVFIQEQLVAVENRRFALTSAVQLEGVTISLHKATEELKLSSEELEVKQNAMVLDAWRARVEQYDTQLKGEMARLDASLKAFEAEVTVYQADAQIASAAGEFDNRRFQLNLAQEQAIVGTEMKRADQSFEQMRYVTSIMLEVKKTLAAVSAQLASAAMSAINIGASMSHNSSESLGYNLGINYSGQMSDGT